MKLLMYTFAVQAAIQQVEGWKSAGHILLLCALCKPNVYLYYDSLCV